MPTLTISIGTFIVKVRRTRAHGKTGQNPQTENSNHTYEKIRSWLSNAYRQQLGFIHLLDNKKPIKNWPPHSIFCEKRCCQKSINSYIRFLKKELKWDRQGHIR
jgi:hypothetical protein